MHARKEITRGEKRKYRETWKEKEEFATSKERVTRPPLASV